MPIYEYRCKICGKEFEVMQKITEEPLNACVNCKGELERLISTTTFILKGSGWYATDYRAGKKSEEDKPSPLEKKDEKKNEKEKKDNGKSEKCEN